MLGTIRRWVALKWQTQDAATIATAYGVTFGSEHGRIVLQHLVDSVYCTVYEGADPQEALVHNARRGVVQEILENVDRYEHPAKYKTETEPDEFQAMEQRFRSVGGQG